MNIGRPAAFMPPPIPAAHVMPATVETGGVDPAGIADRGASGPSPVVPACPVASAGDPLVKLLGGLLREAKRTASLAARHADDTMRSTTDTPIDTLSLPGYHACEMLSRPDAYRHLRELRLVNCRDSDLVDLARVLQSVPRPPFELVVIRDAGTQVTAPGWQAIAASPLSSLTLEGMPVAADAAHALSHGGYAIAIALPHHPDGVSDVDRISLIPTLTAFDAGGQPVSNAAIRAFRSHAALSQLSLASLTGEALRMLAASTRLSALSVETIQGDETQAYAALAANRVLTSLTIRDVTQARHVMSLARHPTLSSLSLDVGNGLGSSIRALADMPSLTNLVLGPSATEITGADVRALCAKPLRALSFVGVRMNSPALAFAVCARSQSLRMDFCGTLSDLHVALLAANPRVTELTLANGILHEHAALVLAAGPALERLTMNFDSRTPVASQARVHNAWVEAGKNAANLDLVVHPVPPPATPFPPYA